MQAHLRVMAGLIILLFSLMACSSIDKFRPTQTPNDVPSITPTIVCSYTWSPGPDDASEATLREILDGLGLDYKINTIGGYGENYECSDSPEHRGFLIMDISPRIEIYSSNETPGNADLIFLIVSALNETPIRKISRLTITLSDAVWGVVFSDIELLLTNGANLQEIYEAGLLE